MTPHQRCSDSLTSVLAPTIDAYLRLKEALGRSYASERAILRDLDRFLARTDADLTPDTLAAWDTTLERLTSGVHRHWLRVARNLCLYRRRTWPGAFVPDPASFPKPHVPVQPYIFTEAEIARVLAAADALVPTPGSPMRREVFRLAVVLLYTTGLRRGELLRLTVSDYDARERVLHIRESKFHKARVLPLSPDGSREIEAYLTARRRCRVPLTSDTPLIWNWSRTGGRGYTGVGLGSGFQGLWKAARIRTATDARPRVHDLRHTFAVHALVRWYRAGMDPQARLPFLAAYMGHVSPVSTAYYLSFVADIAEAASARFLQACGTLVTAESAGDRT
jgi:integrase/recombinase XerD